MIFWHLYQRCDRRSTLISPYSFIPTSLSRDWKIHFRFQFNNFNWLTPTLAEWDISHAGGWSLRRPFSSPITYTDLFKIFDPEWPWISLIRNFRWKLHALKASSYVNLILWTLISAKIKTNSNFPDLPKFWISKNMIKWNWG